MRMPPMAVYVAVIMSVIMTMIVGVWVGMRRVLIVRVSVAVRMGVDVYMPSRN